MQMESRDNKWLDIVKEKVDMMVDEVPTESWPSIFDGAKQVSRRKSRFRMAAVVATVCVAAALALIYILPYNKIEDPIVPATDLARSFEPVSSNASAAVAQLQKSLPAVTFDTYNHSGLLSTNDTVAVAIDRQTAPSTKYEPAPDNYSTSAPEHEFNLYADDFLAENTVTSINGNKLHISISGNRGMMTRGNAAASTTVYQWCSILPDGSFRFTDYQSSKSYDQLLAEYLNETHDSSHAKDGATGLIIKDGKIVECDSEDSNGFFQWLNEKYGLTALDNQFLQTYSYRHLPPVTSKLALSFDLSDRWSVESGAVYSFLASEVSAKVGSATSDWQKLHFVGIPLTLRVEVLKMDRSSLYAAIGGQADKCIKATGVLYGKPFDRLYWSTNINVGYQFSLNPHIGIFIESGVAYHFDNGSEVHTVYTERPLQSSLQAGLRMNLLGQ